MRVEFLILNHKRKALIDGADVAVAYRRLSHPEQMHYRMAENWSKSITKTNRAFIEMVLMQLVGEDIVLRLETWESLATANNATLLMRERGVCEEEDIPALLVPVSR